MSGGLFFTGFILFVVGIIISICLANTYEYSKIRWPWILTSITTTCIFASFIALSCIFTSYKHMFLMIKYGEVVVYDYCVERTPSEDIDKLQKNGFYLIYTSEEYRYDDNSNNRGMQRPYKTSYYIKDSKRTMSRCSYEELVKE